MKIDGIFDVKLKREIYFEREPHQQPRAVYESLYDIERGYSALHGDARIWTGRAGRHRSKFR